MTRPRLDDAGEIIPAARKHIAEKTGPTGAKVQTGTSLRELWAEPDWEQEVRNGRSAEVIAFLMCMYRGLAKKPPTGLYNKSDEELRDAYTNAIIVIRDIAELSTSPSDIKNFHENFIERMGLTKAFEAKVPHVNDIYPAYIAGRITKSRLRAPVHTGEHQHNMGRWLHKMGWPDVPGLYEAGLFPLKMKDGTWRVAHAALNQYNWSNNPEDILPNEEETIRAIHVKVAAAAAASKQTHPTSKPIPKRPASAGIARIGPCHRLGEDISPERFLQEFGLKGIQFGNYITQSERQVWLNNMFDGLADLADILQFKRKWIGFAALSVSVGARGQGLTGHAAHYEPELAVFNLTKESGAGSICHEWGHGLDARICKLTAPNTNFPYASLLANGAVEQHDMGREFDSKHILGIPTPKGQRVSYAMQHIMTACGHRTQYFKTSIHIDMAKRSGGYWANAQELFARALEAFVQDELTARGQSSPWLVHGTLESDYDLERCIGCPYPTGQERESLREHFQTLFAILREK